MNPELTQPSLLSRIRDPSDQAAWREFEAKYRELILRFCRRRGLQQTDAEDVLQLAMTQLVQALPKFVYDKSRGRFRDYLYQTVRSAMSRLTIRPKARTRALDTTMGEMIADEDESQTAELWQREWVNHHYRLAMESVKNTFEARSIEVFERSVRGESVEHLAQAFEISTQAVHKIRQRIRNRMEELIADQVRQEDEVQ